MDQSLQGAAAAVRTIALQMLEERGRGAVLVGVARVDTALERLLLAVLLPSPGRSDALFQPDRPLGSFGARISLAHRLGLIESPVERALHTLRRVRNAFAHSSESASLGDPAYAERLAQAYRDARANPLWAPLESVLSKAGAAGEPPVDPALRDYILLITILVAFLEAAAQQLSPRPPAVVIRAQCAIGLAEDPAFSIHTCRHTCASKLASSGVNQGQRMAWGGWTSLAAVQRYMHLGVEALAGCVKALEE